MRKHHSYDALFERYANRYAVTIAVAKRARELHDGADPLVDTSSVKPVTQSLDEFMADCVSYDVIESYESLEREHGKAR